VLGEISKGPITFGMELQDSRTELADSGTPLSSSFVDPLDVLQAYVRVAVPMADARSSLQLGRMTIEIGSERVAERLDFANAVVNFTGAYWRTDFKNNDQFHAFYTVFLTSRPTDRQELENNTPSGDEEEWGRRFWGLHYRKANAVPAILSDVWVESFVYGINETDTRTIPTPNRDYLQPGVRFFRPAKAGSWDFDVETSWRTGSRRATSNPADIRNLDVNAHSLHAEFGYTFDVATRPRLRIDYDYMSGDRDPSDGRFDQYERVVGARRSDLGAAGIMGLLTPANLDAPGMKFDMRPNAKSDVVATWKAVSLASARDSWVTAGVRDASGRSGRFVGHLFDFRARYWLVQDSVRLELGASALFQGRFARTAPNAAGNGNTRFGYLALTTSF